MTAESLAITIEALPKADTQIEMGDDLIKRALNPGSKGSSPNADQDPSSNIKSKRGCERLQRIIGEKRDLEKQV